MVKTGEVSMDRLAKRYYDLKQKQKEMDQELAELRQQLLDYCREEDAAQAEFGSYSVKVTVQHRREYDEAKLFERLPDLEVWRMLSKPDTGKIAGLIKLKIIPEEAIKDTYVVKEVALLQVDKK